MMNQSIKNIIKTLDNTSGQAFFNNMVSGLAQALEMDYVFIALLKHSTHTSQTIALHAKGEVADNFEYELKDTPCFKVADNSVCCFPQNVSHYFPEDKLLVDMNIQGYVGTPLHNSNGEVMGLTVALSESKINDDDSVTSLFQFFSGRIAVELERIEQNKKIQILSSGFHHAAEAIMITDKNNQIIQINLAFEQCFGYTEHQIIGKKPSHLSSDKNEEGLHKRMWQSIHSTGKWSGEIVNQKSDGCHITMWVSITTILDQNNNIENYMAIYSDITEIKQSQAKIKYLAYHDPLTTLYNKAYLNELLEIPQQKTLLLLNINNFNYINSAYGFNNGDNVLSSVAHKLRSFGADYEFNIQSDEFALLFDQLTDIKKIIRLIQKYFSENPIYVNDLNIYISFTYGAAFGNQDLLRKASLAIKNAKQMGRNRYVIFDHNNDQSNFENHQHFIEATNLLHQVIEQDDIVPYFQGIRNNQTGEISKYEALMRISYEGEILSPYPFLEAAKFSGLLPIITRKMIDKSFQVMAYRDEKFSINISEDDLNHFYLESYIKKKCDQYQINPKRIILEILEGVSADGQKNHVKQLHHLKDMGISIAIDDFGAEYSNFERLLEHDINYLKIDARYIKDIDINPKSYEITRAIVFFAKNAGILCIAEFVHSSSVQQVVEQLGIDFSQGYLFSKPHSLV